MVLQSSPDFNELGVVTKAHGTQGGFLMEAVTPEMPLVVDDIVYIRSRDHQWIPHRISEIRVQNDRKRNLFFVKLEGILTRTDAESLRGYSIMTDRKLQLPDPESSLLGYQVVRNDETVMGIVVDVTATVVHSIICVNTTEKEILVPNVDHFVSQIDHDRKIIFVKNTSDIEELA